YLRSQTGEYYIRATDSFEPDNNVPFVDEDYWVRQYLGSEYAPVYYPGVVQVGQAQVVSAKSGDEVQADFSTQRTTTVEVAGRVRRLKLVARASSPLPSLSVAAPPFRVELR